MKRQQKESASTRADACDRAVVAYGYRARLAARREDFSSALYWARKSLVAGQMAAWLRTGREPA